MLYPLEHLIKEMVVVPQIQALIVLNHPEKDEPAMHSQATPAQETSTIRIVDALPVADEVVVQPSLRQSTRMKKPPEWQRSGDFVLQQAKATLLQQVLQQIGSLD